MEITSRITHDFIALKVDEINTTVWKDDIEHVERIVDNLFEIIEDLTERTESKTIEEFLKERGYESKDN